MAPTVLMARVATINQRRQMSGRSSIRNISEIKFDCAPGPESRASQHSNTVDVQEDVAKEIRLSSSREVTDI